LLEEVAEVFMPMEEQEEAAQDKMVIIEEEEEALKVEVVLVILTPQYTGTKTPPMSGFQTYCITRAPLAHQAKAETVLVIVEVVEEVFMAVEEVCICVLVIS